MIKVRARRGKITVTGHAGYGAPGSDIVCAGVSVLFQTMLRAIQDVTPDRIDYKIAPGEAEMTYAILSDRGVAIVDAFFTGIVMMAEEYPENVQII
ncbi:MULTISPECIES: ribosomal-processing cysteine protease Prp [Clostridia]|uniref:ribosomal-processing cysteine protease Prp n=1 Tax=Clostridia TaxID=186801 RepID=UPI000A4293B3|nr:MULTISPECIES: ribosomal-processing cysteine protease Prp [Clostridia]